MALFGNKELVGVDRVSNALKVFHDTAIELDKGVEEIDAEKAKIRQEIQGLQGKEASLAEAKERAINASSKIKAILG